MLKQCSGALSNKADWPLFQKGTSSRISIGEGFLAVNLRVPGTQEETVTFQGEGVAETGKIKKEDYSPVRKFTGFELHLISFGLLEMYWVQTSCSVQPHD
ncbi:hypothetical protein CSUI_004301, partial [Cystoisospora suis]